MNQCTTVIGGGVIGLSVAWELARRGLRVTLVERGRVGTETSWSAAGILPPANLRTALDPIDQLRGLSNQLLPQWIDDLQTLTQMDCGYRRCGGWYLAETIGERAAMGGLAGYWQDLGIECESVSIDSLLEREPALNQWARRPNVAAWWTPEESQIRPPHYLQTLVRACALSGVEILENAHVADVREQPGSAEVLIAGQWRPADAVVICGGAWTGRVGQSLRLDHSIVPIRGQILLLKTDQPHLQSVVNLGHQYIVCRDDGFTLIGSCEEEVGFELGVTDSTLAALREFAIRMVPALASAEVVDSWSGLRPMTFDGFPMIGRIPDTRHLYVAAGHYRSGVHLSPATAVVLADEISGVQPPLSLEPFRIGKQQTQPTLNLESKQP
jgi:glycine oxidase